jgi:hypothetical protein
MVGAITGDILVNLLSGERVKRRVFSFILLS